MSEKKATLLSFWYQDWKTVKIETEKKKNQKIIYTDLNERHHGIKRTNLYRSEISMRKSRGFSK